MTGIGETLSRLRQESGLSQTELARRLSVLLEKSVSNKSVSRWEHNITLPDVIQFLCICRILGVIDPYAAFAEKGETLNALGWHRLDEYRELLLRDPRFRETAEDAPPARFIRLYDLPASAGLGNFLDSGDYTEIEADGDVPEETDFAVRLDGDSMEPNFSDGGIVYVLAQNSVELGEIGVFVLNDEVYCKKLGRGRLVSLNPRYKPIPVHEYDSFYTLGKILG
jgi:transcriptional regulator with XRE-family HTH domain